MPDGLIDKNAVGVGVRQFHIGVAPGEVGTVALLPGCSHFITEDAPQTVGPLIYEYLRSHYLGQSHHHAEPGGPVPVSLERPPRRSEEEE